jgi:hypothetical protein
MQMNLESNLKLWLGNHTTLMPTKQGHICWTCWKRDVRIHTWQTIFKCCLCHMFLYVHSNKGSYILTYLYSLGVNKNLQGLHKSSSTHMYAWFHFRKNTLCSHIYCISITVVCSFIPGIFLIRKEGLLCVLVLEGIFVSWTLSIIWYSKDNTNFAELLHHWIQYKDPASITEPEGDPTFQNALLPLEYYTLDKC